MNPKVFLPINWHKLKALKDSLDILENFQCCIFTYLHTLNLHFTNVKACLILPVSDGFFYVHWFQPQHTISNNFNQIWQCALDAKYGQRKHYRHVLSMTSNIVLYWILWTVCRHLKSSGIILAFSTQHEAYLSCIIAAFLRPTNSLYVCWNPKKIINITLNLQYECMYLRSKKRLGWVIFLILKRSYG